MLRDKPQCNVLAKLDADAWRQARKVVISVILHTDMTFHFKLVSQLEARPSRRPPPRRAASRCGASCCAAATTPPPAAPRCLRSSTARASRTRARTRSAS